MYKILVLQNTDLDTIKGFLKAKEYFKKKGIEVSFFTKLVNELVSVHEYKKVQGFNTKTGQPALISYKGLDDVVKDNCRKYVKEGEYDTVLFCYDREQLNIPLLGTEVVTSWSQDKGIYPKTEWVQLVTSQYEIDKDKLWQAIIHELMHSFCKTLYRKGIPILDEMDITSDGKPFYKNDDPYAEDGNFARTFSHIKPYLNFLYAHPYKWFSVAEVEKYKLHPDLWVILDKAREIAGVPFIITSGFRTPEENKKAGGKSNSAHLRGLAVDIVSGDNFKRSKILKGLAPFLDDIFLEEARKHFHIDIDLLIHEMGQAKFEPNDD